MEQTAQETYTSDPISEAARTLFGMTYLFPYQRLVVGNIMEAAAALGAEGAAGNNDDRATTGRQIVILPTGAGKSLCFQLPAMLLEGPTLVIYPILSFMADQERRLAEKNFAPVLLRGGQSAEERTAIFDKLKSGASRFIISNPEVLLTEKILAELPKLGIAHIVIDEAHCVSEWGESFRPSYLEINRIIEASGAPLVTAFTATASALVLEKIERFIFGSAGAHRIIGNPDRSNISYAARGCVLRDLAVRDLISISEKPAIVFCSSRPGTEKLARYLRNSLGSSEVRFYHAGLERAEKTAVEKWFFSSADGILVATCAYGMGVDKPNIRTVIHRDCPPSVEAYLQESGRAGRDGGFSRAWLLWGPDDEAAARRAKTDSDRKRLEELFAFARNTMNCRRETLLHMLNYEGESTKPESECCDVCTGTSRALLREQTALTEFFRQNKRALKLNEAAVVLARNGHIGWSADEARCAITHFIDTGILHQHRHFPWKDTITIRSVKREKPGTGRS
ncbi:MAG: RecQ family ATP-dependent DNA helicase [Spirochaetaceae bacterium]|jgi:ATP-dependent DNA helicase RecQ|nr:RecQ family ATP-dependent DNA helicase [Spirochaetaceae bacterium]